MNLFHLKYFFDAARLQSTTQAAKLNHVTQSAISQAIRSLESNLKQELITHRRNHFELTDAGQTVLKHCELVFAAIENIQEDLSSAEKSPQGTVTVATTNSLALTLLAQKLADFSLEYPGIHIVMKLGNSDQVKEYLGNRQADFGIILDDDQMKNLEQRVLHRGQFRLVAHKDFKFKMPLSEVIVTRENKIEVDQLREQFKKKLKVRLRPKMETFSWELTRKLCQHQAGVGYLPDYLIRDELKAKELKIVLPEIPTWDYKVVLIHLSNKRLGKIASLLASRLS